MQHPLAYRSPASAIIITVCTVALSLTVGLRTASAANTAPTVTLVPSASSITAGQTITLTWNTIDAKSCTGSGFTTDRIYGSVNVAPITTTTYSITCTDGRTSTTATTVVDVAVPASAPVVTIVANPSIIESTGVSTLSWSSANVTECTGSGFSANTTGGTTNVGPAVTTTYSISCQGPAGMSNASVTLNVNQSPLPLASLNIGVRVRTTDSLNVRSKAGNSGGPKSVLFTQPAGSFGTITEGPVKAGNNTWWNISYETGCSGWSVQDYLTTNLALGPNISQVAAVATTISALSSLEQQLQTLLEQVRQMISALKK